MRENDSKKEVLMDLMTPWLKPKDVAERLGVSITRVREYATRDYQPMPVHYPPGNEREWRAFAPEVDEWALSTWRKKK